MKYTHFKIATITLSLIAFLAMSTPAHASILGEGFFKAKIDAGKGNIFQNRDNRNQLLEKAKSSKIPKPLTAEERQAAFLAQLSVSVSNLFNIHDRISARAAALATSGQDVAGVTTFLSTASDELMIASSTIQNFATITATSSPVVAAENVRTTTIGIVNIINLAKDNLQQALNALEQNE